MKKLTPSIPQLAILAGGFLLGLAGHPEARAQIVAAPTLTDLVFDTSTRTICAGGTATIEVGGGSCAGCTTTYTWSPNQDISATTGNSVVIAPLASQVYTVTATSTLNGQVVGTVSTNIDFAVDQECCFLKTDVKIVELEDAYGNVPLPPNTPGCPIGCTTYRPDPFAAYPPGTYFKVKSGGSLTLYDMAFNMPPGSVLLMAKDADVILDDAILNMNGSVITAECDEMWGALRLPVLSHGLFMQGSGSLRNRIMHSKGGIMVEDAGPAVGRPEFQIADTDFLHNYQSMGIERSQGLATATDFVTNCTFDSNPDVMKAPYRKNAATYNYTQHHLRITGDLSQATLSHNTFRNAMIDVLLDNYLARPIANLEASSFSSFYVTGVLINDVGGSPTPGQEARVTDSNFTFPEATGPLATAQYAQTRSTYSNVLYSGLVGISSPLAPTQVQRCTFEQLNYLYYPTYRYQAYRSQRVGIQGEHLDLVEANTFRGLHAGIIQLPEPQSTDTQIKGNAFLDCQRGYVVPGGGATSLSQAPTVLLDCNTFARTRGTSVLGQVQGIYVEPTAFVKIDDPNTSSSYTAFLRNLFSPGGSPATQFMAIQNDNASYLLRYNTYTDIKPLYAPYVNSAVEITAPISPPVYSTPGQECAPTYPGVGIPRASNSTATPQPALEQNAPNPVDNRTSIAYHVPSGTKSAALLLRRLTDGVEVARLPLSATATTVEAELKAYPAGVYAYTLLADGVPLATRRLVIR